MNQLLVKFSQNSCEFPTCEIEENTSPFFVQPNDHERVKQACLTSHVKLSENSHVKSACCHIDVIKNSHVPCMLQHLLSTATVSDGA